MNLFFYYFLLFFIYSVIGWIIEMTYTSIVSKKIVNRGFLIGPYCPIYGSGALGMILYLTQYKDNLVTVFILGVVICSILEYFTSYIMELIFKTRWWDYSDKKFNLDGRICGENACLFGAGGVLIIYLVEPLIESLLSSANDTILMIIGIILFIIFLTDTILSFNIIKRFKDTVSNLEVKKDQTQEISRLVREKINAGNKIFQERLYSAFPDIDLSKLVTFKKSLRDEIKGLLKK